VHGSSLRGIPQSPTNCRNSGQDLFGVLSQNFSATATAVSPKRLALATMRRYPHEAQGKANQREAEMQLHCNAAKLSGMRAFAAPARCPHCGDCMVAPLVSEFVVGGEIRHHWECDACGEISTTLIPLATS
jgi:hypothetical protein